MKNKLIIIYALQILIIVSGKAQENKVYESNIRTVFLFSNAEWLGDFQNYVNRNDGIIQNGRILVEITFLGDTIKMRNAFFNQQGVPTDYTGYSNMLVQGDSIISPDDYSIDENTGNELKNYKFWGRILDNHIYIHESYNELFPDGKVETRSNSVHYYLKSKQEIIQLADVWINDSLFVFAGTLLRRKEE